MSERPAESPGAKAARSDALTCAYNDRTGPARLVVTGVVDISTVDQFATALAQAAASGRDFVVDVRALTVLSAVGVRALWRHQADIAAIVVTAASAVHQVLTICGIRTTSD